MYLDFIMSVITFIFVFVSTFVVVLTVTVTSVFVSNFLLLICTLYVKLGSAAVWELRDTEAGGTSSSSCSQERHPVTAYHHNSPKRSLIAPKRLLSSPCQP